MPRPYLCSGPGVLEAAGEVAGRVVGSRCLMPGRENGGEEKVVM